VPRPQPPTAEQIEGGQPVAAAPREEGARRLDLELVHLGSTVKAFAVEADPADAGQLARLLRSAVRRYAAGADADIGDFELIVRNTGEPTVVTVFLHASDSRSATAVPVSFAEPNFWHNAWSGCPRQESNLRHRL
jgi:hypothetical protein